MKSVRKENKEKFKQYFTPPRIARFMLEMIRRMDPQADSGKVTLLDPACGEGVFLENALEMGMTDLELCMGYDKDETLREEWKNQFGPESERLFPRVKDSLFYDDGRRYRITAGNPPYGILELEETRRSDYESFEVLHAGNGSNSSRNYRAFPVEVLFIERFLHFLEPGGIAAIVLPQGIFTNDRMTSLRRMILEKYTVLGIVFLKKKVFTTAGASANTGLLFLRKSKPLPGEKLIAASASDISSGGTGKDHLDRILDAYTKGEEIVTPEMTCVFPQLDQLSAGRWDPEFYHPMYENLYGKMAEGGFPLVKLSELLGPEGIVTGYKGPQEKASGKKKVKFLTSRHISNIGITMENDPSYIDSGSRPDSERSRLRTGDVLLVRSGEGCIGRGAVVTEEWAGSNIRSEIYILRLKPGILNPWFFCLFLQCFRVPFSPGTRRKVHHPHFQVARLCNGVGTPNLNKSEILSLQIPLIPPEKQNKLGNRFKTLCKKKEKESKLKNLLKETEEYLTGENFRPLTSDL